MKRLRATTRACRTQSEPTSARDDRGGSGVLLLARGGPRSWQVGRSRARQLVASVAACAVALTLVQHGGSTLVRGERISITTHGATFRLASSDGSDRGSLVRFADTEILCGGRGRLTLQLFGRLSGTWRVASGTGAYLGWRARGRFDDGLYGGLLVEAE
jgi:hypothetical protein